VHERQILLKSMKLISISSTVNEDLQGTHEDHHSLRGRTYCEKITMDCCSEKLNASSDLHT